MLKRDYIQRMLDEFARVVAYAIGLKADGRNEDAVNELRNAYRTWFALDAGTISLLSPEELRDRLVSDPEFPNAKIEALANGLKTEAELLSPADPLSARSRGAGPGFVPLPRRSR
jgi:hypothetical protein